MSQVSSSLDGTLKIGDLERRSRHCRQLGEVERHGGKKGVYGFQWSSLFKVLASCGLERTVSIWNPYGTRGGKPLAQLVGHTSSVQQVALNEESCQLISCDLGKTIKARRRGQKGPPKARPKPPPKGPRPKAPKGPWPKGPGQQLPTRATRRSRGRPTSGSGP